MTRLLDFNDSFLALFGTQVQKAPKQIAVSNDGTAYSYIELDWAADKISDLLLENNVIAGEGVAICLPRGTELIAALIGVHKCGAHFILLDPTHPSDRLSNIINDSQPCAILTQMDFLNKLPFVKNLIILNKDNANASLNHKQADKKKRTHPRYTHNDIAYIMYTSGSTGKPKGVAVTQAGLSNYLIWAKEAYSVSKGCGALVTSSVAVDFTLTSLLLPLVCGRIVFPIASDEPDIIARAIQDARNLSFLKLTPGNLLLLGKILNGKDIKNASRILILGGEQLTADDLIWLTDGAIGLNIVNEYGPTETVIGSSVYSFQLGDKIPEVVPIGRPISNTRIYVVNSKGELATRGEIGELYISGVGVAKGYRRNNKATESAFLLDPFASDVSRLYKTGDIGYIESDGNLVFRGRRDHEVKIHGYRVNLREIESTLLNHIDIYAATVVHVKFGASEAGILSAFKVPNKEKHSVSLENEITEFLSAQLPVYMRPSRIEVVNKIPLTASGKIDRKKLRAQSKVTLSLSSTAKELVPPEFSVIADIWQKTLGRNETKAQDNFFAMGGDSIRALLFVSKVRSLGLDITLRDVFEKRTFGRITAGLQKIISSDTIVHSDIGSISITPHQRGFLELDIPEKNSWSLVWRNNLPKRVEVSKLQLAFSFVLHRHTALRSRFHFRDGSWTARILDKNLPSQNIEVINFPGTTEMSIEDIVLREQLALHLDDGPITKLILIESGENKPQHLVWIVHHLVVDIMSWHSLIEDLFRVCYDKKEIDREPLYEASYHRWCKSLENHPKLRFPIFVETRNKSKKKDSLFLKQKIDLSKTVDRFRGKDTPRPHFLENIILALCIALIKVQKSEFSRICVEKHGRSSDTFDVSRTVGWLTSFQEIMVTHSDLVEKNKDLPNLIHSQLMNRSQFVKTQSSHLPEVALNFLGDISSKNKNITGLLRTLEEETSIRGPRLFPLEVVTWISGKDLKVFWVYDPDSFSKTYLLRFLDSFKIHLINQCSSKRSSEQPSSMNLSHANLSSSELSKIIEELSEQ